MQLKLYQLNIVNSLKTLTVFMNENIVVNYMIILKK
jgi:hypothetical protein